MSAATQPSNHFALVHGYITYADRSDIWAVNPNHPANRISLGSSYGLSEVAWAPDGSRLPIHGVTPIAWARDGSRLLLMELKDAGAAGIGQDLCVMNADGSQKPLTSGGRSGEGSFSPDGTEVVFARSDEGLYVVDAKGGVPRLVAKSYMAWWLGSPAWSPDGSRIAYTVYLEGRPEGLTYQIWTVSPDGTNPQLLVDLGECGGGGCSGGLAWSPDGAMLAFHSMRANLAARIPSIYVVRADGSGLRQITHGPESDVWPAWSPDGSRIAFIRVGRLGQANGPGGEPFTIAPDGSDLRHLDGVAAMPVYGWAWNPVH